MGDWEPDASEWYPPGCYNWCQLYLWIVPARVEGAWRAQEGELKLSQKYQTIAGTLAGSPISNGKLAGEEIRFGAGGAEYRGRVNGNVIEGTVSSGAPGRPWRMTRSP